MEVAGFGGPLLGVVLVPGLLAAGIASGQSSFRFREGGKNACVMLMQEPKLAFRELGRRMAERGALKDPMHVFQLLESELDAFLLDPASFTETLAGRHAQWLELAEKEPPYLVQRGTAIPPISQWPMRKRAADATGDIDSPPFSKALMDGYAVRSSDFVDGQATVRCIGEVDAGQAARIADAFDPPLAIAPFDVAFARHRLHSRFCTCSRNWSMTALRSRPIAVSVRAISSYRTAARARP